MWGGVSGVWCVVCVGCVWVVGGGGFGLSCVWGVGGGVGVVWWVWGGGEGGGLWVFGGWVYAFLVLLVIFWLVASLLSSVVELGVFKVCAAP